MTNDEYLRIFKKAKDYAARFGFGDEAEDFAQEYAIKCLNCESDFNGSSQSINWAFIDYSRTCRNPKRLLSGPSGYLSKNLTVSLDKPLGPENDDGPSIIDTLGSFRDDVELESDIRSHDSVLNERERMIWEMYSLLGMTLSEIGFSMGFSESRAFQLLSEIKTKIIDLDVLSMLLKKLDSDSARHFVTDRFIACVKD